MHEIGHLKETGEGIIQIVARVIKAIEEQIVSDDIYYEWADLKLDGRIKIGYQDYLASLGMKKNL